MKRIIARQKAVDMAEVTKEQSKHVTGGASYRPTMPGADMEVFPGFFGEPYEPTNPGGLGNVTFGINEN